MALKRLRGSFAEKRPGSVEEYKRLSPVPRRPAGTSLLPERALPPSDGGHSQSEDELLVKKHQAQPLELFKNLLDTLRRHVQT